MTLSVSPISATIEARAAVDAIDVDAEVVRITPRRALVLCPYEQCAELRARLPGTVIDMTGALAGLELEGERPMRRMTHLDLELPAGGEIAHIPAHVLRGRPAATGSSARRSTASTCGRSVDCDVLGGGRRSKAEKDIFRKKRMLAPQQELKRRATTS